MNLRLLAVGRLKKGPLFELCATYQKRLTSPLHIDEIEIKDPLPEAALKKKEEASLLTRLSPSSYVIALDLSGKNITSEQIATRLETLEDAGQQCTTFLIGGAFGLDTKILACANEIWAFGKVTWPHLQVRLLLLEQLYRAQQIRAGHPYHK